MKRLLFIFVCMVFVFIAGTLISIPIHNWYTAHYFVVEGHDDEMKLVRFLMFVEWPTFLLLGGILGNFLYKKNLTTVSS